MRLCLDGGNTLLKWGLADKSGWAQRGLLRWEDLPQFAEEVRHFPPVSKTLLAHVAGDTREAALRAALPQYRIEKIQSGKAAGGVINGYKNPEKLGVDRWCALIGARAHFKEASLVVTAGTATTIDSLSSDGHFLGGLILPGVGLMKHALAEHTAGLPFVEEGRHVAFADNTADAIVSGVLEAQAGAVERAFERLPNASLCLVSGGAAPALAPLLSHLSAQVFPGLVLEGVRQLSFA
ncbi:MAG: type III pantothenate kinase [Zoogloeaceae bacterium]|jgi:type III pantothenate kinase|nr:type III pantothenate kinase [Zoogloeaceae bacterium]